MRSNVGNWESTPNLHAKNEEIGRTLLGAAMARGLRVTRYVRNYGRTFDGFTFYAVYVGQRPQSTRSARVFHYTQARHSKYGEPSIVGEYRALADLLAFVAEEVSA